MTQQAPLRVLVMAGGTGGHVFPGLAVAEALRNHGAEITWLGTRRGLESEVVPRAGFDIRYIRVAGLRGKGWLSWLLAPARLLVAVAQGITAVRELRPAVVLGLGGFASGPGGFAAWLLRRPLVIQEQNARAGLTNRLLSHFAQRVLEGFPNTFSIAHAVHTGNPVRAEIAAVPEPSARQVGDRGSLRLLVLGGSLGAVAINAVMPQALVQIGDEFSVAVWHQAGKRNVEAARADYARHGVTARVESFVDDMAAAYAWADLVLCRAGALTVAELSAAGVGAILVPFPHAVDDHQTANAHYLSDAGAALLLPQSELNGATLAALLRQFHHDRARLLTMAQAARAKAMPAATQRVVQYCLEAAHG